MGQITRCNRSFLLPERTHEGLTVRWLRSLKIGAEGSGANMVASNEVRGGNDGALSDNPRTEADFHLLRSGDSHMNFLRNKANARDFPAVEQD